MFYSEPGRNEFRKFAVHHQYLNGLTVDRYLDRFENMTRSVIEERPLNFREVDVFSR
ncbi:MAG TPA: ATP-dependent Clp protease proteolytic subunit, partial [Cytophagales bacterium]